MQAPALPTVPDWKNVSGYDDILYAKADEGIAKITINRPEVRNAFRPETVREMQAAFADARTTPTSASSSSPGRASVALFGFAASGSLLSLVDPSRWIGAGRSSHPTQAAALSLLCSASILIAFTGLARLPLDYFRLALEPVQLLYLLGVYLLLALPFFFSGAVIAMAYVAYPLGPGAVYFASMTGSALGAMAPLALLAIIGEAALVALSALAAPVMLLAGVPAFFRREASGRSELRSARAIVAG